jgi:hypothetical protein
VQKIQEIYHRLCSCIERFPRLNSDGSATRTDRQTKRSKVLPFMGSFATLWIWALAVAASFRQRNDLEFYGNKNIYMDPRYIVIYSKKQNLKI